jgi:hypothetical protein
MNGRETTSAQSNKLVVQLLKYLAKLLNQTAILSL